MQDLAIAGIRARTDDEPFAYHVTIRLLGDRVIAPSVSARRAAARCVLHAGAARRLVAFRIADTHLHALLAARRAAVGDFIRSVTRRLHGALDLGATFEPARLRCIRDQRHLASATKYVFEQESRHGLALDPLHDTSSLPDLIGARVVCSHSGPLLRELLPRFEPLEMLPPLVAATRWEDLHDAAAAAFGLGDLRGRTTETVCARRAAVHAARIERAPGWVANALGVDERTVRRLHHAPCPAAHVRAVGLQLRWRAAIRDRHELAVGAPPLRPDATPTT